MHVSSVLHELEKDLVPLKAVILSLQTSPILPVYFSAIFSRVFVAARYRKSFLPFLKVSLSNAGSILQELVQQRTGVAQ